jgi:hypothetical protein
MRTVSRLVAFVWLICLLSLPVLGADEKDKKADPPKGDVKKAEVKKDDPAKKDEPVKKDAPAKKEEPAKKDVKKNEATKSDTEKKMPKLPAPKGKYKGIDTDPEAAEKKLMKKASINAEVMSVYEDKKVLRLKLTIPYVRVNQGQLQNYINAQMSMLRATNAQGILNAQQQMINAEAQIYEVATTTKEVEWSAADDVKVRNSNPPARFDEKGRVKRYTAKELKELRGNDKLPGFPAEFSDVKTGQIVQITLLQKKITTRPKRGKDGEGDLTDDNLPKMSQIIILREPANQ